MTDFLIGHNNPPTIEEQVKERLADSHVGLIHEVNKYAETINKLPEKVSNEKDAQNMTTHIKQLKDIAKQAEAARKSEKDEYFRSGKAVDEFFKELKDLLAPVTAKATDLLTEYQVELRKAEHRRLEAEHKEREEAERLAKKKEKENQAKEASEKFAPEIKKEDVKTQEEPALQPIKTKGIYGGTSTLKEVKEIVISDPLKLDLNKLKGFISETEILKALRQYEKKNGKVPEGAKIIIKQEAKVF